MSSISAVAAPPEVGQMVSVRSRSWTVTDVQTSALPSQRLAVRPSGQSLLTLSSIEDDGLGEELQVVWELEPGARIVEKVALPEPVGIDPPARLDAFLDAVRWGAVSSADRRDVQAPFRAGIDLEDYQLDPLVRALQMPRVNLLIADDVGLGKTIEAGLVALELLIRHRARRILVVCPSALQVQWHEQLRDKFGLEFRVVDSALMKELRRTRGIHVNPWTHFPRLITSIDFLKRERPLRLFREVLPGPSEPLYPRKFDLLIIDEAHHAAPAGRGRYALESQRTKTLQVLAPHFEHRLFLTATPHNGYPESFTALLELLDNQRFARGTPPDKKQLGAVMVRRLKTELPPKWDGTPRFPKRDLVPLEVAYTDEERAIHRALAEYGQLRMKCAQDHAEAIATEFVLKTLKKRLFSSPAAFLVTLKNHEESLLRGQKSAAKPSPGALSRELDRIDEDYGDDDAYEEATADALDTATQVLPALGPAELLLLQRMQLWAEKASAQKDTKVRCLLQWLQSTLRPGGKWNQQRVILFTEYRATQKWLHEVLALEGLAAGERVLTMTGGMDSKSREAVKAAFQAAPEVSPVRILLATDAASEGLDLQNHCANLIHYEIPWNPNRMEQRNGRIDRHGQRAPRVLIHHFVGAGYSERQNRPLAQDAPGDLLDDLEFLMRVAQKVESIREDLGSYSPVLAEDVERAMLGDGYRFAQTLKAAARVEPVRKLLKFEQDLRKQIESLVENFRDTQRELRLSPDNIQSVVEVALQLADQPRLIPSAQHPGQPVFILPALRGSWTACAEGLVHPHTKAIRPITFDHKCADGRDDVVLVHLNHRLVQMSLRLLRAEVWAASGQRRLHRITARTVPDHLAKTPVVIAHARVVIIGGDTHRLHEEIITTGGEIKEGKLTRLKPADVDALLAAATEHGVGEAMQQRLLGLWDKLAPGLAQALEARTRERTTALHKKLIDRRDKEAQDITAILQELKRAIERELHAPEDPQLLLFSDKERSEFDQNKGFLQARLAQIPDEIVREVAAIHTRYADPQARMFPVAVTFLVPERMAQ